MRHGSAEELDVKIVPHNVTISLPTAAQLDLMAARGVTPILLRNSQSAHGRTPLATAITFLGVIDNTTGDMLDNDCRPLEGVRP